MGNVESKGSKATTTATPISPGHRSAGQSEPSLSIKVKTMEAVEGQRLEEAIQRLVTCLLQDQA